MPGFYDNLQLGEKIAASSAITLLLTTNTNLGNCLTGKENSFDLFKDQTELILGPRETPITFDNIKNAINSGGLTGNTGNTITECIALFDLPPLLDGIFAIESLKKIKDENPDYFNPGLINTFTPDCKLSINYLYSILNYSWNKIKDTIDLPKLRQAFNVIIFLMIFIPVIIYSLVLSKFNHLILLIPVIFSVLYYYLKIEIISTLNLTEITNTLKKISICN